MPCRTANAYIVKDVEPKLYASAIYLVGNLFNIQTGDSLRIFRATSVQGYPTEENVSQRVQEYEAYVKEKYGTRFNRCLITPCDSSGLTVEERRHVRIMRNKAEKDGFNLRV